MAYNDKSLSRQSIGAASAAGGSQHSAHFIYRTADTKATVETTGYFNNARRRVKAGDLITVVSDTGTTAKRTDYIFTSVPSSGNVVYAKAQIEGTGVEGVAAGYKVARGQHTTVAASDTVVTGLTTVVAVVVQLDDDPVDGVMHVTGSIGDQAGTPAAGSVLIKSWKSTDGDATLIAGTTFTKRVNWVAFGT